MKERTKGQLGEERRQERRRETKAEDEVEGDTRILNDDRRQAFRSPSAISTNNCAVRIYSFYSIYLSSIYALTAAPTYSANTSIFSSCSRRPNSWTPAGAPSYTSASSNPISAAALEMDRCTYSHCTASRQPRSRIPGAALHPRSCPHASPGSLHWCSPAS